MFGFRRLLIPALAVCAVCAGHAAHAAPVVFGSPQDGLFGAPQDLDHNGVLETEYSRLAQQFTGSTTGTTLVTVRFMVMTSESSGSHTNNSTDGFDTFLFRIRRATDSAVLSQVSGTISHNGVDNSGTAQAYNFDTDTITPSTETASGTQGAFPAQAVNHINSVFDIPAGGTNQFNYTEHLADGVFTAGSGSSSPWFNATLRFAKNMGNVYFEAILADSGDKNIDSVLLIDNVTAQLVTTSVTTITPLSNPSFESNFNIWTHEGETGIYSSLSSSDNTYTIHPSGGSYFAALGLASSNYVPPVVTPETGPTIPEPASLAAVALGATLVLLRRREA